MSEKVEFEYEVEYSWQETMYGVTSVKTEDDDMAKAELIAFKQLAESFDADEEEVDIDKVLTIESIRKIS